MDACQHCVKFFSSLWRLRSFFYNLKILPVTYNVFFEQIQSFIKMPSSLLNSMSTNISVTCEKVWCEIINAFWKLGLSRYYISKTMIIVRGFVKLQKRKRVTRCSVLSITWDRERMGLFCADQDSLRERWSAHIRIPTSRSDDEEVTSHDMTRSSPFENFEENVE